MNKEKLELRLTGFLCSWARNAILETLERGARTSQEWEINDPQLVLQTALTVICALGDPECPGSEAILQIINEQRQRKDALPSEEVKSSGTSSPPVEQENGSLTASMSGVSAFPGQAKMKEILRSWTILNQASQRAWQLGVQRWGW